MTTPVQAFDNNMEKWTGGQREPWGKLRYNVTRANLKKHIVGHALKILDAGGGNGIDSIPFASDSHHVTIVDYSEEMLKEAHQQAQSMGVESQISAYQADVATLPELIPEASFDVVLCHNVMQYVEDPILLLQAVTHPLRTGGILSLMSTNRLANSYRAAFQQDDLEEAFAKIDSTTSWTVTFDVPLRQYSGEDVIQMLPEVDCNLVNHYGVRCLCDYLPNNERKYEPEYYAQLEKLELTLSSKYPYYLLARFFHVIAQKMES